ncbi:hypothetical protein P153DRAFT_112638 [Dothidotthia symphoricarpi CBS 119687]|uniref:Uncharacterized protein n=1 Tax=Dothidotthia symphoricarpi CBS 119687 TaxID=1392245 RepID=A0A6A6A0S1_9PLEO|nr:uncharacterized protein P153DRAFT_112638 [Dothidotthia symphoricarpi CBS 119687]KAF2125410.1 hypothetical protein P153DRAFT_112638 [Dothidotthia symphoricarpi CBS 119687]
MPATRPHTHSQTPTPTHIHTAIIASTVLSIISLLTLIIVLLERRKKAQTTPKAPRSETTSTSLVGQIRTGMRGACRNNDGRIGDLEVGVIREPAPVYSRECVGGERRVAVCVEDVGGEGWRESEAGEKAPPGYEERVEEGVVERETMWRRIWKAMRGPARW